jgi:hypothetical protein
MRRYDDPVETRMGLVSGMEGPEQFLWRGRLWKVRAVLAHWVETGPWWQSGSARAVIGSDETAGDDRRSSGSDRWSSGSDRGPSGSDRWSSGSDRWSSGVETLRSADLLGEREVWRVEAGRGAVPVPDAATGEVPPDHGTGGVFDLAFDWSDGRWALVGCVD